MLNDRRRLVSATLIAAAALGGAAFLAGAHSAATAQPGAAAGSRGPTWAQGGKRERWTPDNCVFAFIDHQTGLTNLVNDTPAVEYKNYVVGLAKLAKIHNIPTVITTSAEDGPNGPKLPEVVAQLPSAPYIKRNGQINAWDDPAFVDAIRKTGRTKIVMSGITTDVCVAFAALSAIDAGFEVYIVSDASGSMSEQTQLATLMRMQDAGAVIGTWFALSCEMLMDWRNPKGGETAQLFVEHFPAYAEIFHSHQAHTKKK